MPKKNNTPASSHSKETITNVSETSQTQNLAIPPQTLKTLPKINRSLTIPDYLLILEEGQVFPTSYIDTIRLVVDGIHKLEDKPLDLLPLIKEGYNVITTEPVIETIFNMFERQTATRFILQKEIREDYVLKYGDFKDLDGDIKYGWYLYLMLTDTLQQSFTRPLTNQFIEGYIIDKALSES
jgi:hypothetical protein